LGNPKLLGGQEQHREAHLAQLPTATLEKQLDSIIDEHAKMRQKSQHNDLSDLPKEDRQSLVTRAIAAVHRISGARSTYALDIERIVKTNPALHIHTTSIIGIVKALRHDVGAGYLQSVVELVHASVFADFLEMAQHLHAAGYKDPAAVICGSTLESHLRELCHKHAIPVADANGKPKKADLLNAELAKAGAYSVLDQKNVTAWLDLRNKAAHGKYNEYTADQVALFISAVGDFIARTPA
jgi:hypothetical protein